jgi:hypothetical protein
MQTQNQSGDFSRNGFVVFSLLTMMVLKVIVDGVLLYITKRVVFF